jgi:hypothetical protein
MRRRVSESTRLRSSPDCHGPVRFAFLLRVRLVTHLSLPDLFAFITVLVSVVMLAIVLFQLVLMVRQTEIMQAAGRNFSRAGFVRSPGQ